MMLQEKTRTTKPKSCLGTPCGEGSFGRRFWRMPVGTVPLERGFQDSLREILRRLQGGGRPKKKKKKKKTAAPRPPGTPFSFGSESIDPANPADPADLLDPAGPTDLADSAEPAGPAEPAEPADPTTKKKHRQFFQEK